MGEHISESVLEFDEKTVESERNCPSINTNSREPKECPRIGRWQRPDLRLFRRAVIHIERLHLGPNCSWGKMGWNGVGPRGRNNLALAVRRDGRRSYSRRQTENGKKRGTIRHSCVERGRKTREEEWEARLG